MGLFQQAIKTYDTMERIGLVGKYEEGKEPLAPIGHIIAKAKIEITIDGDGRFISASAVDKKIIIPATEGSSGRAGTAPAPHPLCDNVSYLCGNDERKYSLFLDQLGQWKKEEPEDAKIAAVYKYLSRRTIKSDLAEANLIKQEGDEIKNEKDIICWRVIGIGEESGAVYEGNTLNSFTDYYVDLKGSDEQVICYVTGKADVPASQHLKGVVSLSGNAKIISANDKDNFTYRGRFFDSKEAVTVGYEASQKAHNALKWLAANQSVIVGGRSYLCWNPNGKRVPAIQSPLLNNREEKVLPTEYKQILQEVLLSYKRELGDEEDIVIVSFDAATTGRLSVGYYGELKGSDFLERLYYWDNTCCWYDRSKGTRSPSLMQIVKFSYGIQRGNEDDAKVEVDDRLLNQQMYRLIKCRIEKAKIPPDLVRLLTERAGNLQIYNRLNRQGLLFSACAVINKFYYDYGKEVCEMSLDIAKKDRSYQYGRLLAVLEKIEKDTYDREEGRETNAIRMQSVFVKRPAYATKIIIEQLKKSYYQKLTSGAQVYYDKLIGQIMDVISEFSEEYNKSLTEGYILGYYLQKNDLYTKKTENEQEDIENE